MQADRDELTNSITLIQHTVELMKDSGSWDAATMQRVVENVAQCVPAPLKRNSTPYKTDQKSGWVSPRDSVDYDPE